MIMSLILIRSVTQQSSWFPKNNKIDRKDHFESSFCNGKPAALTGQDLTNTLADVMHYNDILRGFFYNRYDFQRRTYDILKTEIQTGTADLLQWYR